MSGANVRRLVAFRDFTHTLSIPLAASASTSQLDNSIMRFQNDTSLIIPPAAILNPRFYNLLIARLNLPTPRHVDKFSTILRRYDMRKALNAAPTVLRPPSGLEATSSSKASIVEKSSLHGGFLPLRIKLFGLSAGMEGNPASTVMLRAKPIDPTNRLPHFLLSLRNFLATTGFMADPGNESVSRQYIRDHITIVNTLYVQWWVRNRKGPKKVPKIDARDLINKYRAYEWGTDIPLEEIRPEKLGSMAKCSDGSAVRKERILDARFELS